MAIRLNMENSALKQKRGISFFVDNRRKDFDLLNIESQSGKYIQIDDMECEKNNSFGKPRNSMGNYQSAEHYIANEPDTAVDTALLKTALLN